MQRLSGPNTQIYLTHTVRPSDGNSMDQFYDNFKAPPRAKSHSSRSVAAQGSAVRSHPASARPHGR